MFEGIHRRLRQLIRESVVFPDMREYFAANQVVQKQLLLSYRQLLKDAASLQPVENYGFRVFSQSDEDGLLLYIFGLISITNRKLIDIAFGSPFGSNSANLLVNHHWHGLLIEGKDVGRSIRYFKRNPSTAIYPPVFIQKWVTAENINEIITEHGFGGEVDLFSLDVDGIDYWLWKNLKVVSPRVVILEYQDILGPDRAITVPYKPDFNRFEIHEDFYGASLPAFNKLAREKGYRLVATNSLQYNAIFVRNDIAPTLLKEKNISDCFAHPKVMDGRKKRYPAVSSLGWVEV